MQTFSRVVILLLSVSIYAQEEMVQSVYFDTNKFSIDTTQASQIIDFVKKTDSTRIESLQIFGYCDDVGKDDYNRKLSNDRANEVKDLFVKNGIKNKVIITIEGKGRILIEDDIVDNLPEVRSKNRRVDVVINLKPEPKATLNDVPGVYSTIQKKHIVGDRIYLENIQFERGSSKLTLQSKNELDKISRLLMKYKNIHFEIQGHVCCTPPNHKEAIDKDTKKRKLSINRAETVYKYLIFKKVAKERMTFKGYGNTKPLGKTPDLDRRVELLVTKI
ncbi:OmpA family protein [Flavobacterium sp. UBA6135]|uniref:OmpA family protein n=1 Tax=Flavobacterium sp. UBA6135 TaxID=1946553 RepID=UPI0025BF90C0|nr:OmpA family protein [Flavobacterium sp. UBA6135]